ncbi:MAG: helix-turn-helix domain-containing protein [Candidatus Hydrogenedentes bacterium]|nr:helix-turn-helix domain-containing protein [Candidatus Hydrogenedentota bacterium]
MHAESWQDEYDHTRAAFKSIRELMGLTQKEAAAAMGISGGTVTNFELGRVTPQTSTIVAFQEQIKAWEKKVGRKQLESKAREKGSVYVPTVLLLRADYECPSCNELTPGPSGKGASQALWCIWCGHALGLECPKCHAIETRMHKKFCGECGAKLKPEG